MDKGGISIIGSMCLRGINSSCSWTAGIQVVQLRSILRENILNYKTILREKYTQIKGQLSKPVCTMCTMSQVCKWTNPLYYLWSRRTPPTRGGSRGSSTKHPRPWEFFMGIPWEFHGNIRHMYVGPNTTHDGGTSARIKTTADQRDGILGHGIQIQWRQPMATHLNDLGNNFLQGEQRKLSQNNKEIIEDPTKILNKSHN